MAASAKRATHTEMHFSKITGREEIPPDLYIDVIGKSISKGWYDYRLMRPNIYLRFMIEGDGFGDHAGGQLRIMRNQFVMIWPGTDIHLHDTPEHPWQFYWLSLGGRNLTGVFQRVGFPSRTCVYDLGDRAADMLSEVGGIFAQFKRGIRNQIYPVASAWNLVWRLSDALGLVPPQQRKMGIAEACREYIRSSEDPITITGLSDRFKVSRSTLFRLFLDVYAMSPKDYLEQVRFERACYLLTTTSLPVHEVSCRCHFESAAYFSRRFKHKYEVSPIQWRRKTQATNRRKNLVE